MAKLLWFVVGALVGAAAAHVYSRTPSGAKAFAAVNALSGEFAQAVTDSFRAHTAESGSAGFGAG